MPSKPLNEPRKCNLCGSDFLARHSKNSFCSRKCSVKNNRYVPVARPFADRFWEKVTKTDTCWLWTAGKGLNNYGQFQNKFAHRVAYELTKGEIPNGSIVLHSCDVKLCCNPAHLFIGSHHDNHVDMVNKRRDTHGEKSYWARFTEDQVCAIREKYGTGTVTQGQLAEEYGVRPPTIHKIVRGKRWKYLLVK